MYKKITIDFQVNPKIFRSYLTELTDLLSVRLEVRVVGVNPRQLQLTAQFSPSSFAASAAWKITPNTILRQGRSKINYN
jgi:hypothetical protein